MGVVNVIGKLTWPAFAWMTSKNPLIMLARRATMRLECGRNGDNAVSVYGDALPVVWPEPFCGNENASQPAPLLMIEHLTSVVIERYKQQKTA